MKYAEINKKFTDKVNEYLNKGYTINSATMTGSQGEVAKIDLTNGKEIIRIMINDCWYGHYSDYKGYEIYVGKAINTEHKIHSYGSFEKIWNNELIEIVSEKYYKADRYRHKDWFVTEEEIRRISKKWGERIENRWSSSTPLPDKAKDIALKYVRKQPKCSRARKESIRIDKKNNKYHIYYRNYSWVLK
jgi:hypothetical protein